MPLFVGETSVKFGPQCFNNPFHYLDHDETVQEVDAYADIMAGAADINATFAVSTCARAVVTAMTVKKLCFTVASHRRFWCKCGHDIV